MRVGSNPAKSIAPGPVEPPPPISVGLLTHVPYVVGYHLEQLDVIRLSVLSARVNAHRPIHLMVVDNGSGPELRRWLSEALDDGLIDELVLNRSNLGKLTAVSQIIFGAPGPDVVYSDGDIHFLPNWLDPIMRVAEGLPNVGVVGGAPLLAQAKVDTPSGKADPAVVSGDAILEDGVTVEHGRFISEDYIREFLTDTGYQGSELEAMVVRARAVEDVRYRFGEVSALQGSGHAQFLITDEARRRMTHHVGSRQLDATEDETFDRATEKTGLRRVSVEDRVVRHVGNRMDEGQRVELERLTGESMPAPAARTLRNRALWWFPVRRSIRVVHDWTFRALYETSGRPKTP